METENSALNNGIEDLLKNFGKFEQKSFLFEVCPIANILNNKSLTVLLNSQWIFFASQFNETELLVDNLEREFNRPATLLRTLWQSEITVERFSKALQNTIQNYSIVRKQQTKEIKLKTHKNIDLSTCYFWMSNFKEEEEVSTSRFLDAFCSSYSAKFSIHSEKALFLARTLSKSENISESTITKSSFLRTFRNGIEKGFAELMLSVDMTLDGEYQFSKPPLNYVTTTTEHTGPIYSVSDEIEIRFKHAKWTRHWNYFPQAKKFGSKIEISLTSDCVVFGASVILGEKKYFAEWKKENRAKKDHSVASDRGIFSETENRISISMNNIIPNVPLAVSVDMVLLGKIDRETDFDKIRFTVPFCGASTKGACGVHDLHVKKIWIPGDSFKIQCSNSVPNEDKDILTARTTDFSPLNEFVLEISAKIPNTLLIVEKSKKSPESLVAHFHTFLETPKILNERSVSEHKLTVVLDGSGSMSGKKIETTHLIFQRLLKSLHRLYNINLHLQVAIFGNESKFLWKTHSPLSKENVEEALQWGNRNINASIVKMEFVPNSKDYGDTNGCSVLTKALKQFKKSKIESKSLIMITDGEFTDSFLLGNLREQIEQSKVKIHTIAVIASLEQEKQMKTISNWGFGNSISIKDISNLDLVIDQLANIGLETPKVEISLNWPGIKESYIHSANSSNTQLDMQKNGKFEQHIIIRDFFKNKKDRFPTLKLKIGGNSPKRSSYLGEIIKSVPLNFTEIAEDGFLDAICAYRKLQGNFERSAVAVEPSINLPKDDLRSSIKELAKKYCIAVKGIGAFHFESTKDVHEDLEEKNATLTRKGSAKSKDSPLASRKKRQIKESKAEIELVRLVPEKEEGSEEEPPKNENKQEEEDLFGDSSEEEEEEASESSSTSSSSTSTSNSSSNDSTVNVAAESDDISDISSDEFDSKDLGKRRKSAHEEVEDLIVLLKRIVDKQYLKNVPKEIILNSSLPELFETHWMKWGEKFPQIKDKLVAKMINPPKSWIICILELLIESEELIELKYFITKLQEMLESKN